MISKTKLIRITILFLTLIFYCLSKIDFSKSDEFKVLEVIEADKFYIDLNKNNKKDNNELFKLDGIVAFKNEFDYKINKLTENKDISLLDRLKNGHLAKLWTTKYLENKYVSFSSEIDKFDKNQQYRLVTIQFKNEDFAINLLKRGYALVEENSSNINYLQHQNFNQIKANIKEFNHSDYLVLNLNTNVIHEPTCENIKLLKNPKIIFKKEFNPKIHLPCKNCLNLKIDNSDKYNFKKSLKNYFKSDFKNFNSIEAHLLSPFEFKQPNFNCTTELCKSLLKEIEQAQESIDFAIYEINKFEKIDEALKNAKNRGVEIRFVINKDKNTILNDYTNSLKENYKVKFDADYAFMHNKFIIFDSKKVLTGSANLTSTGLGGYNANFSILINSSELAKYYQKEFNQMFEGKFSKYKEKFIPYNKDNIEAYFQPKSNSFDRVVEEIKNAEEEIYISAFYLTNRIILSELELAKARGVEVLIILDATGALKYKNRLNTLKENGIQIKTENWGGKNHNKSIVIDSKILITGSANFSFSGFNKNDENILIIKNEEIAKYYRDYFLFLFNQIPNKYLFYTPQAEGKDSINSCSDGLDNDYDGKIDKEDDGCN